MSEWVLSTVLHGLVWVSRNWSRPWTFNAETLVGRVKGAAYFRSHDCKKPGTKIYQIYMRPRMSIPRWNVHHPSSHFPRLVVLHVSRSAQFCACYFKLEVFVALLHIMLGEQSWSCSSVPAWCKCTTDHASVREKTITASKLVGIYWFIWMTCLVYFVSCLCYLSFLSEEAIFLACSYKNSAVSCKAGWTLWRKRPCGTLIWFSSPWML